MLHLYKCPECGKFHQSPVESQDQFLTCAECARGDQGAMYTCHSYDVWGNTEDGWEVNDVRTVERDIWISGDVPDGDVIEMFKRILGIDPKTKIVLDSSCGPDYLEFELAEDGYPLGRFERQP